MIPPPEFKIADRAVSLLSEINKNGVYQGAADAFERAMEKYAVYKPIDLTVNLAASAFNIFKGFNEIDSSKLTIGFGNNQLADSVVEKVSSVVQESAKDLFETVKNVDPNLLTAGIVKTQIPAPETVSENKQSAIVQVNNTKVKFIIDGDTFVLDDDSKIRLIGIDAPEQNECFYDDAKNMLADLVLGKEIILEKDISDTDKYDRLLRYGRINDILVNDYMIREGFAEAWAYGLDIKYREKFAESQNYAQNNNLGLWDKCNEAKETKSFSVNTQSLDYIINSIGNDNPPQIGLEPEPEPEDVIPPITPFDINIENGDLFAFADDVSTANGAQINIFGKGEGGSIVVISVNPVYEAEAASNGTWQREITLNEGANAIKIKARDEAGNESEEIAINVILDSLGPAAQINITNYNLMSLVFNVGWIAAEEDAATTTFEPQYKINANGEWQDLVIDNGEQFSFAQDKTTYYFRVRVQDMNGNQGGWSEIAEAEINTKPVIFNEIAWMGTEADYNDEWIELYNISGQDVDLKNWKIEAYNGAPNFTFFDASRDTMTISANSYFLLERTGDETVFNIAADFIYTGAMTNKESGGEYLYLKDSNNIIIDEVISFYAGDNVSKKTMERVRSDVGSNISANWLTYEGEGGAAQDAEGNAIFGTPKFQNSVHNKHYAVGGNISENTSFYKSNSPYFLYSSLNVLENNTLVIEPGVKILIDDNLIFDINGTLKSLGTATDRVVFTSDEATPEAGDWTKMYFSPTSNGSEMFYTDILYGGKWIYGIGGQSAAIEVATSTVSFSNVLVKESAYRGLWLRNSASAVNDVTFDNINAKLGSAMLEINGGNPQINNSVFKNSNGGFSSYGINILNRANPTIANNSFSNTNYPVYIIKGDPVLSENTASGNSYNGIWFDTGYETSDDVVLEKNLPYYVNSLIGVKNNAILTINAGAEIKFNNGGGGIEIQDGTLKAIGTSDNRIKFTSVGFGLWKWIHFTEDANEESELKYAIIENGGYGTFVDGAMIRIDDVAINIDNVEIINSYSRGVMLKNSDSIIANALFKCNGYADFGGICNAVKIPGLVPAFDIQDSDPVVSDSVFKLNRIGIGSYGTSTPAFTNITFGEGNEANIMNTDPVGLTE